MRDLLERYNLLTEHKRKKEHTKILIADALSDKALGILTAANLSADVKTGSRPKSSRVLSENMTQ